MKNYFLLFLALFLPSLAPAQQLPQNAKLRNVQFPYYSKTDKVLKSMFSGKDATTVEGGLVLITQFEMQTFRNGDINQVQFVAKTPECFFNPADHTSYSSNFVQAYDASTNIYIEGFGFYCAETNIVLIVSNNVETRFHKKLIKAGGLATTPAAPSIIKNDVVKILSDHFELFYTSNLFKYERNVRVIDPQMQLNCDLLVGHFDTNRVHTNAGIDKIVAERNVVILTPYNGRATGEKAIYISTEGVETVELTGDAVWSDGADEIHATRFLFDHNRNTVQADGSVRMRLADSTMSRTNTSHRPLGSAGASSTNGYTELFADHVTVQLSATNAPPVSFLAENNVVVTNQLQGLRATGQKAFYTAANEQIQLTGQPLFQTTNGELRGQLLSITGRTNPIVKSIGDARLKMSLGKNGLANALTVTPAKGPSLLDVASDTIEYHTNLLTFTKDVHAQAFGGTNLLATLDCQLLTVELGSSNQVRTINARTQVKAVQPPTGLIDNRTLQCNSLVLNFWPGSDYLRNALFEGDVRYQQIGPAPRSSKINAGMVTALFATSSNTLEHAEAEHNVSGEQDEGSGAFTQFSGQRVVYSVFNTNEPVQVTGTPVISYWMNPDALKKNGQLAPPAGVNITDADCVFCNPVKKTYRFTGPYHVIDLPPRTNTVVSTPSETAPTNEPKPNHE